MEDHDEKSDATTQSLSRRIGRFALNFVRATGRLTLACLRGLYYLVRFLSRRLHRLSYNYWPLPLWLGGGVLMALLLWRFQQPLHLFWQAIPDWLNDTFEQQRSPDGTVVTNSGKPRWTYLAPAAAGAIGGLGALITYIFNHRQREIQFDRGELEARFKDVQDRFASPDTRTRASAALRLADMGMTRGPGRPHTVTDRSRPFFLRATAQLSISLYMEEDARVRATLEEALRTLVDFAARRPSEKLLDGAIEKLADANKTARAEYCRALAEYANAVPDLNTPEQTKLLCTVSPFCVKEATTAATLEDLMREPGFASHKVVYAKRRNQPVGGQERRDAYDRALATVENCASRLIHTRDVLAYALRVKREHWDFRWTGLFLAGTSFVRVKSKSVDFSGAYLQGTNFANAKLPDANMVDSKLQGATFDGAHLREADFRGANLLQAQFNSADLRESTLFGANLRMADLRHSQLAGAFLTSSNLEKAKVYGSNLDEAAAVDPTWITADFSDGLSFSYEGFTREEREDTALRARLAARHTKILRELSDAGIQTEPTSPAPDQLSTQKDPTSGTDATVSSAGVSGPETQPLQHVIPSNRSG